MKICTKCFELKEMYHGRCCRECRKKYMHFLQQERYRKNCPICKKEMNSINSPECSIKCKILNRHKVVGNCWEWQGKINNSGYGCFTEVINGEKKELRAHRESYKIFVGEIQEGLCVLHKCDNPACCNPEHLWLGTPKENTTDCVNKGRFCSGRNRAIISGKLTEDQVIQMRELYKTGASYKDLHESFNISLSHISGIINHKFWKHI